MRAHVNTQAVLPAVVVWAATLFSLAARADIQGQQPRVWTDVEGRTVTAVLVAIEGDSVKLSKDGRTYKVPLSRFSETDRGYVNSVRQREDVARTPAPGGPAGVELVVGRAECPLFDDQKLDKSTHELSVGTRVLLLAERSGAAQIEAASGKRGWVRRCHLCSAAEFKRRQAADEVPKNVVCVGSDERGSFVYGGTLSIVNNAFTVMPGDAFWMDPTMKGKSFNIGAHRVIGDPSVLVLYKAGDRLARLPIRGEESSRKEDSAAPGPGSQEKAGDLGRGAGKAAPQETASRRVAPLKFRKVKPADGVPASEKLVNLVLVVLDQGGSTIWIESENQKEAQETDLRLTRDEGALLKKEILASRFYGPFATEEGTTVLFLGDVPIPDPGTSASLAAAAKMLRLAPTDKVNISVASDGHCLVYRRSDQRMSYFAPPPRDPKDPTPTLEPKAEDPSVPEPPVPPPAPEGHRLPLTPKPKAHP